MNSATRAEGIGPENRRMAGEKAELAGGLEPARWATGTALAAMGPQHGMEDGRWVDSRPEPCQRWGSE